MLMGREKNGSCDQHGQAVLQALNELIPEGSVIEVRILGTTMGTLSGYFNDPHKLIDAIIPHDGKHNIFFTINPVNPALIARSANRLTPYAKQTTADGDIDRRIWLPIDIDPQRPAGVSASLAEKEAACALAEEVKTYLCQACGWSQPVVTDSGNGMHLLFPVDLPNDTSSRDLIRKILQALDFLFSNEKAKIDLTTFNAARIMKLYGTMAVKGDHTSDRPHRRSSILSFPEEQIVIPLALLEAVAAKYPNKPPETKDNKLRGTTQRIDVDAFIEKHGLDLKSKTPWQGGTRYILSTCPWKPEHTNAAAYIVQFDNGAVAAGCHHDSCSAENWHSLRDKLEPGWQGKKARNDPDESDPCRESQSEVLIRLASDAKLFHTPTGDAYATVQLGSANHCNYKVGSRQFKQWLTKQYYLETCKAPGSDAMSQAIGVLEAMAVIDGPEKKLFLRVAESEGNFFYDLCDANGNVLEISIQGFKIADNPPDIFRRTKNMSAQVMPLPSGDAKLLAKHINTKTKEDELLFVVTTGTSLVPNIAHPALVVAGEKGAAKTTIIRKFRKIVDPASRDLYVLSHSEQDLAIVLANNYAPCFDNIESISPRQSDMLCMASTGGGISKRTLYTDDDETILEFKHCVGLNGINVVATRPDLLDRSVIIELDRIPAKKRQEEDLVWKSFTADLPSIMGGYFSALSKAMLIYPTVKINSLPRMADYCRWGYALAEALGYGGQAFLDAYTRNISRTNENAINEDPVAAAVVAFMRGRSDWQGYVAKLLIELERVAEDEKINVKARRWPKAAHVLTSRLKEVKSNLEEVGIRYERQHDGGGTQIRIENNHPATSNVTANEGKSKTAVSNRIRP